MKGKFEVLNADEIHAIHAATLDVLEHAGATFRSPEALRMFEDYGALVNYDKFNVKIPSHMVEELVRKAPKSYVFYGRNPKRNVVVGGEKQFLDLAGDCSYVVDMGTDSRRFGELKDCVNFIRLSDALGNTPQPYPVVRYPRDVPEELQHVELSMAQYKNTSAPMIVLCEDRDKARECIELAATAAGGEEELRKKPNAFNAGMCPSPPLLFDDKLTEGVMECAKHGLPVWFLPMDNAGASAPITLAGTLVQTNATNLAGICLIQIINPGLGVSYGDIPCFMDFRTGIASVGCPEEALHCVAATQMARHYGLPSMIWSGISDSKIVDVQAGYESALCLLPTLLAGANRLVCGALESYNSACYESVVIEDEIFGMAKRMAEGIEVNEATMAVPLISKIAPLAATKMGGHFMAEKHTLGYAEKERYIPKISDKRTRETWVKTGSKTLTQVAKERVHEILAKHEPESPASDILRDMNKKAEEIKQRILSRRR